MTTAEVLVPLPEKADLAALMQDYIAEMAAFVPGVKAGQAYPHFDDYWLEPDSRWPFWLVANGAKAGFALLRRVSDEIQIAEFFVAERYRRGGVGRAAARRLIARFPGPWRITQRETNTPAIAFWHRVLDGFVAYEEMVTTTDAVRREQRFTIG